MRLKYAPLVKKPSIWRILRNVGSLGAKGKCFLLVFPAKNAVCTGSYSTAGPKRKGTTIEGSMGTMEKKMETTIVSWGSRGIMEKKMEATIVYWGSIGIMNMSA